VFSKDTLCQPEGVTQRDFTYLSLTLQGRKRDLVFIAIAIGELHVGLSRDILVIPFWKPGSGAPMACAVLHFRLVPD
jgi:hypothetical protein